MKYAFYYYLRTLLCDMNYYSLETNLTFENVSSKKYVI